MMMPRRQLLVVALKKLSGRHVGRSTPAMRSAESARSSRPPCCGTPPLTAHMARHYDWLYCLLDHLFPSVVMPDLNCHDAGERLASAIQAASAGTLREIASDLLTESHAEPARLADELAATVRRGVEPELLVDLWNVVFPEDHDVWFNEETNELHYESGLVESAD